MAIIEAFIASQNCYFNYDFEELDQLDGDFPEELLVSLRGMLYRHKIQYPDATYFIYYSDILTGDELEKMQADWMRYCPLP
ncbi:MULTISPECIES: hypothetical protein [unclassified Acinetobacter]|uniref:hypothetical protein n=1 Tax=unclassified Acinetobacter TaxID=196816 RepID=UPI002575F780|nr:MULTISPECIES: hypothetical protein [unclassified Acinetobacter]MDM1763055.1 hypothetical protein [Acinetobacter sp. 226-1]MDM1766534.1 hypothetical protein [Acinetobacter sp. 226-4]